MTVEPLAATLATAAVESAPEPAPPALTWFLCDMVTGQVLTELPLVVDQVTVKAATKDQATFTLAPADDSCPDDWAALLVDGRSMIVLTIDDQPAAGWWVESHTIGGTTVSIVAWTLEQCADRANVPDYQPDTPADYSEIAAILAAPLVTRYGFTIEHTNTGNTTDELAYDNTVDRTIFSALQEDIQGADEGPEWRMFVRWTDDTHTGFDKVLSIQPQIGMNRPNAIFDLDANGHGNIDSYTRETSYAQGKGATMLIGVSDGSGSTRPMTDPQVSSLVAAGWPVVEERHPFTGLDDSTVEDEDALLLTSTKALLVRREGGNVAWTVTGTADAPVPGRDYNEGDTVHIDVAPQGKLDPIGGTASVRLLGWTLELTPRRTTLIVWPDDDDSGSV